MFRRIACEVAFEANEVGNISTEIGLACEGLLVGLWEGWKHCLSSFLLEIWWLACSSSRIWFDIRYRDISSTQ